MEPSTIQWEDDSTQTSTNQNQKKQEQKKPTVKAESEAATEQPAESKAESTAASVEEKAESAAPSVSEAASSEAAPSEPAQEPAPADPMAGNGTGLEQENAFPVFQQETDELAAEDPLSPRVENTAMDGAADTAVSTAGVNSVEDALAEAQNITAGELVPQALQAWYDGSEEAFRDAVCAQAKKYLGTEYRWGGKSGRGIDCSGLVSSAYMQCGVLIYRDARIVEGWPMHQIPFADKKRGDALYFPGHIALYLGEGRYIHSTGASASGGVVINSLDPADPLYREDLVKSLYAVGSVF